MGNSERDGNTRPPDLPFEKLYAGQEATVRTEHETTDWFQIGKWVCQGCILSPCLFNLYAEMATRSSVLAWRIPGTVEPDGLPSMGPHRVGWLKQLSSSSSGSRVHHEKGWAGRSPSWNQDCLEKYQQPQTFRWYDSNGRKWRGTKDMKEESEKADLKLKNKQTNKQTN